MKCAGTINAILSSTQGLRVGPHPGSLHKAAELTGASISGEAKPSHHAIHCMADFKFVNIPCMPTQVPVCNYVCCHLTTGCGATLNGRSDCSHHGGAAQRCRPGQESSHGDRHVALVVHDCSLSLSTDEVMILWLYSTYEYFCLGRTQPCKSHLACGSSGESSCLSKGRR